MKKPTTISKESVSEYRGIVVIGPPSPALAGKASP